MMSEERRPEWIRDMQVLRLRPGDVIVLRTNRRLGNEEYAHVKHLMTIHFPNNKLIFLEDGIEIGVITHERETDIPTEWIGS